MEMRMRNVVEVGVALIVVALAFGLVAKVPQGEAKAFFVFGDSLVDNGNNNYLMTTARADSPPYGVDFPTHKPTGRFSNGYNFPDLIGQYFGFAPLLPYLSPDLAGNRLLLGANFASAGVGILNDTGFQFLNIIRIYDQIALFEEYKQRLIKQVGAENAKKVVNQAIVLITLAGNDFVNNYYLVPYSLRSQQFTLPDFCTLLVTEYKRILQRLYDAGARRVLVTGAGSLGCVPAELAQRSRNGECAPELQEAASIYNPKLVEIILSLNKQIGIDVFVVANTNQAHSDFLASPQTFGFENSKAACCGQGPYNGLGLCTFLSNLCTNREAYVFWDPFHPTEKASRLIVQQLMNGSSKYITPMNLSTIKLLDFQ